MDDRCFACGRRFRVNSWGLIPHYPCVLTSDGQRIPVGFDCYKKIQAGVADGYQPPRGGPRLYTEEHAPNALRITITKREAGE